MNVMDDALFSLDPDACVSASDLVRRFGEWQEKALSQPVFIIRRGRPSLVLTSFDLMRRLCAPAEGRVGQADRQSLLLDTMREAVLTIDRDGRIAASNRAARIALGLGEAQLRDRPLAAVLPEGGARFLLDTAARARRHGTAEAAEIAIGHRHFAITIAPDGDGALLLLHDRSEAAAAQGVASAGEAVTGALAALGDVAVVRINQRGYIDDHSEALQRMTGIAGEALATVRFVTLLDIASRVAVGDAIEQVLGHATALAMDVRINVNRGEPIGVRLALAPERDGPRVGAVRAILVAVPAARS